MIEREHAGLGYHLPSAEVLRRCMAGDTKGATFAVSDWHDLSTGQTRKALFVQIPGDRGWLPVGFQGRMICWHDPAPLEYLAQRLNEPAEGVVT